MTQSLRRPPLQWSTQLEVLPEAQTAILKGDRIILPSSALEGLLAAARSKPEPYPTFDRPNPQGFFQEFNATEGIARIDDALPYPLSFRLVNPANGRVLYVGVREFTALEGRIGLSAFVRHALNVDSGGKDQDQPGDDEAALPRITVHVVDLPKGTFVKLRPLEAGYDVDNWKAFLEQQLRDTYTTLTIGEEITIVAGKERLRFLVDELRPDPNAVSIIDTDLEVDIEPLSEEQARETLEKLATKSQKAFGGKLESSQGGQIDLDDNVAGQVGQGHYVDYSLSDPGQKLDLTIEITNLDESRDVDLFVTPFNSRHRSSARQDYHIFADMSSAVSKTIRISHSNADFEHSERLLFSVRGWPEEDENVATDRPPIRYNLHVSSSAPRIDEHPPLTNGEAKMGADEERCPNCFQAIPKRTILLHQNFCQRNNVFCHQCRSVFQKSSQDWKGHWHCPHDSAYGNSTSSKAKHDFLFHERHPCPSCDYLGANVSDLAFHRATSCLAKTILCQFCHLEVPQQGAGDPSQDSAEVLLSGLTPHEVTDGARTTECHICARIVRMRDMAAHLKNHSFQRLSRSKPRICRNANCGHTLDQVEKSGDVRHQHTNDLTLCDTCFGPLYVSQYDPDGKAIRRRVERKYLSQLLTGCNQAWCLNEYCKTGRKQKTEFERPINSKEAGLLIRPFLDRLQDIDVPFHLCTDEANQRRRKTAEMLSAEIAEAETTSNRHDGVNKPKGGYDLEWCIAALQLDENLDQARVWLQNIAPQRGEVTT